MERPSSSEPIRLFPSIAVNVHMRKSITSLHLAAIDCRTSGKLCEAGCALSHVVAGLLPQISPGVGEEIPQSRLRDSCLYEHLFGMGTLERYFPEPHRFRLGVFCDEKRLGPDVEAQLHSKSTPGRSHEFRAGS